MLREGTAELRVDREVAVIGFRAKTGRAIAVVLTGDARKPQFVWRGEVGLIDPKLPLTEGPYHPFMEMPWSEAQIAVQPVVAAIEKYASVVLRRLADEMHIRAVGVVGSPPRNIEKIGNQHIRAHAAEGILFRRVLELAAKKNKLACTGYSDRDLRVPAMMKEIGRAAGPPWRTDERLAATAAWLALSR
jgi:hypothetical protein